MMYTSVLMSLQVLKLSLQLSIRLLCSLPIIVCMIVSSGVSQATLQSFYNGICNTVYQIALLPSYTSSL